MEKANAHYFQDLEARSGKLSFTFYVCGATFCIKISLVRWKSTQTLVLREALSTYFIAKNPDKVGLRREAMRYLSLYLRYNTGRPGFFCEGRSRSLNNKIRAWPSKKLLYIEGGGPPLM